MTTDYFFLFVPHCTAKILFCLENRSIWAKRNHRLGTMERL